MKTLNKCIGVYHGLPTLTGGGGGGEGIDPWDRGGHRDTRLAGLPRGGWAVGRCLDRRPVGGRWHDLAI